MSSFSPLEGKLVVLGVCGSIAAVETVRLARALQRRGARVQAVISPAACRIIHPDALTYATGTPAITTIGGMVEHVRFCGEGGSADLLLVAPATANTLCKMASGIDDTPVTTFATTALGRGMPLIVAPAMHESMFRHPAVVRCIRTLEEWGVIIIGPRMEEGRAKIALSEEIVLACERELSGKPLAGRHVLVTSGPCQEKVDDVRVLTTRSEGLMGQAIALQAFRLGARVTVVHGSSIPLVTNIPATSAGQMMDAVMTVCQEDPPDLFISAAAVSDFAPEPTPGKIPSGKPVTLTLRPLPKIITRVAGDFGIPTVAFKLGHDAQERAGDLIGGAIGLVVANKPGVMGKEHTEVTIISRDGTSRQAQGSKEKVAAEILAAAIETFSLSKPATRASS
ncbi:MAG: bifunctional phosphopantothenoylcysteine decarboxylase/phosphopantothenate--cysteine ligase CoaBC [Methanolinea sp.]|nr:bifunctional phosphopantothenoylcysteine decarboxylase/phosphopantothenate--cysteine ligase CoaBC [Methanolinea sp.]